MMDGAAFLTEIIAYFSTAKESPGDAWAHPDDFSSYGLDHQSRDGTKFWIDLEQDGTIMVLWKPVGQQVPTIKRFSVCGHEGNTMTSDEKILWLINYWKVAAERSQSLALKVSGEGEAAEIYRDTEKALRELYATRPRS